MLCHVKPELVVTVPEDMILWWEKAVPSHWTKLMATMQLIKFSCMKTSKFHPRLLNAIQCGPIDNWTPDWFTLESHRVAPIVLFIQHAKITKRVIPLCKMFCRQPGLYQLDWQPPADNKVCILFITEHITYSCITKLLRILPNCGFCCREFWKARKVIACKFPYKGCSWTGQVTIASFEIHIKIIQGKM